jgi:hypothetical protein
MPSEPIELECPECDELLELDAGFAGGVCRCSSCGALMTVPADPQRGKAEQLTRPEAPGEPARPARPDEPPAEGTYVTESGQKIQITKQTKIPVANKKIKAARYTTIAVFILIMAVILGVAGFVGFKLLNSAFNPPPEAAYIAPFEFDKNESPYNRPGINVLGMPLAEESVVILDLSAGSDAWRETVQAALIGGLKRPAGEQVVRFIAANGEGREATGWLDAADVDAEVIIRKLFSEVLSSGQAKLGPPISDAVDDEVDQIIILSGRDLSDEQGSVLKAAIKGAEATRVDVVMIEGDSVVLDDLAVQTGGAFGRLKLSQLEDWNSWAETSD